MKNPRFRKLIYATLIVGFAVGPSGAIGAETGDSITNFLKDGKVDLDIRARYEGVQEDGVNDANATTLRTRLGYTTPEFSSISANIEFSDTRALDGDAYNQAGLNPDGSDRAVVADPVGTELNRIWVAYMSEATSVKLGRQRLVYDNARFIGDVGWRQKMQTYDAFSIRNSTIDGLILNYAYIDQVNRVFGSDHPSGVWDSKSHLLNGSFAVLPNAKITGYGYLLDFENAAASSCQTYGLSFDGTRQIYRAQLAYRLEYARQTDYGSSELDYGTNYWLIDLAATVSTFTFGGGYEVLGTNNDVGFQTPLATLHKFNGWADLFLSTPSTGLRDFYLKVAFPVAEKFSVLGVYHKFDSDSDGDFGKEFDLQVGYKYNKYLTALLKYAEFDASSDSIKPDVSKFWVQAQFSY